MPKIMNITVSLSAFILNKDIGKKIDMNQVRQIGTNSEKKLDWINTKP